MKTYIRIIRKDEQGTGTWAGGTTTQLAIWPPEADYGRRDFEWRMSSARVDLEESTFTVLPGIRRLIMILEGRVHLVHEGHHEAFLDAFDQDSFEGGWNTLSRGRCVDFNLMMAEGCCGSLEALKIPPGGLAVSLFPLPAHSSPCAVTEALYILSPELRMTVREENDTVEATLAGGDFVLLRKTEPSIAATIALEAAANGTVSAIRATVWRHPQAGIPRTLP